MSVLATLGIVVLVGKVKLVGDFLQASLGEASSE